MKRAVRSTLATVAVALAMLPSGPRVVEAGSVSPDVGFHALAVAVSGSSGPHFDCQDRHLDDPSGQIACLSPQAIRSAYGFNALLSQGITGAGRSIVIIDAFSNPYIRSDLCIFNSAFGLPDAPLHITYPDGRTPFDLTDDNQVGWSDEISLDVEWAHAVAPAATIELVLAKSNEDSDIISAIRYAVDHDLGDVISQSCAEAETCALPPDRQNLHMVYVRARARGMTVFASSGNTGAARPACDSSDFIKATSWPASDPLVTAVGGTNLRADTTTGRYVSERAWSDSFSNCLPSDSLGCSGGGFSTIFDRLAYQEGARHTRTGHRGVPDVAYDSGLDAGVLGHWGIGDIVNGYPAKDPDVFFVFGGTSVGAPQWAALTALADQYGQSRVGFINGILYGIMAADPRIYQEAFHDITSGNNNFNAIRGYDTSRGWDAVTGLGSPKAAALVPLLAGAGGRKCCGNVP